MNCANANDQPATCLTSTVGDSNTQNLNCHNSGACNNGQIGDDFNTQNLNCHNSGACFNSKPPGFPVTTQNTACQSSGECGNGGLNTNVLANSAPSCESDTIDTTTICQQDRTFTFPNH